MKKLIAVAVLGIAAFGASALDLGINLGGRFGSYVTTTSSSILSITTTTEVRNKDLDLRIGAVASLPYFQLGIDFFTTADQGGSTTTTWNDGSSNTSLRDADRHSFSFVAFQGLLKYPLKAGRTWLSPMAGLEYDVCVGAKDSSGAAIKAGDIQNADGSVVGYAYYSKVVLRAGLSADFALSGKALLRPWILAGCGLSSLWDADRENGPTVSSYGRTDLSLEAGAGLVFRL